VGVRVCVRACVFVRAILHPFIQLKIAMCEYFSSSNYCVAERFLECRDMFVLNFPARFGPDATFQ